MKKKACQCEVVESVETELYSTVRAIIAKARSTVYVAANAAMVEAYWNVGREIVVKQGGKSRAKYGEGLVKGLAVKLTAEFGAGYTASNLFNMRQFYLSFPKFYTLCRECITDSFHAVMFSYICNCNVRFLRPANEERKAMFARIEEFAQTAVQGAFLANDLPAALASLDADSRIVFNESVIDSRRRFSQDWLIHALQS